MNVRDFVLQRGADEDVGDLADAYLKEALAIKDAEERDAALTPAIRQLVSQTASSLRKAQRGPTWTWPSAQSSGGSQRRSGRAAVADDTSVADVPAAVTERSQLAWLRERSEVMYYIPGTGQKAMADVSDKEWDHRGQWFEQMARGNLREAAGCRNFASFLRQKGVATARELFGT